MMHGFTAFGNWNAAVWRRGRAVEGTSLLRKHTGLNLYPGFESLRLRQKVNEYARFRAFFIFSHGSAHAFQLGDIVARTPLW